jgi:hypothetical protein
MSGFRAYSEYQRLPLEQMQARVREFAENLACRRTLRDFSPEPVPKSILEDALSAAASAPSGANRQPWHFVVVSRKPKSERFTASGHPRSGSMIWRNWVPRRINRF